MRNYNYHDKWVKLLTPKVVGYLTTIHEYKGEQRLVAEKHEYVLMDLIEIAKIQSTESSNKIEGIFTSDDRLKKIVLDKTVPRNRGEKEIAGYRDVLNTIHENYEHIPVKDTFILQMHRDLYKYENTVIGGVFKNVDNFIEEQDSLGNKFVRFKPVPAWETAESVERLCNAFNEALKQSEIDALILIPMFILDFLCIHPFLDGNGRMSRLLTLLLLYQSGYSVGKYISIEKIIETTKNDYYEALKKSSIHWYEEENDYEPFVTYMLGVITASYRDFFDRTKLLDKRTIKKPNRVEEEIKNSLGMITKSEIMERLPGVSQTTIQRALAELLNQNKIKKIGNGRYTKYTWNWEDKDNDNR